MDIEYKIRGGIVLINAEDLPLIEPVAWRMTDAGYAYGYAPGRDGRKREMGMHRFILGDPPSQAIDHINRDPLDNRRGNLRAVTTSANCRNIKTRENKTSRHRGVSWNKASGKWQAVIRQNGKLRWLGLFDSEDEAWSVVAPHFFGIAE